MQYRLTFSHSLSGRTIPVSVGGRPSDDLSRMSIDNEFDRNWEREAEDAAVRRVQEQIDRERERREQELRDREAAAARREEELRRREREAEERQRATVPTPVPSFTGSSWGMPPAASVSQAEVTNGSRSRSRSGDEEDNDTRRSRRTGLSADTPRSGPINSPLSVRTEERTEHIGTTYTNFAAV